MVAIAIAVGSKCNIRCKHCCLSCGPRSEEHLSDEQISNLIDQCIKCPSVDTINFTGGEALLHQSMIIEMITKAHAGGLHATIVSNGFWGINVDHALHILRQLRSAGLSRLTLSYDDFHEEFIPASRIVNILTANAQVHIPCAISMAVTRKHDGLKLIEKLGESAMGVPVTRFPVVPAGRASQISATDLFLHNPDEIKSLRCPSYQILYHYDGKVYPCCSPSIFNTALTLGSISSTNVLQAQLKLSHSFVFSFLQQQGFLPLLKACQCKHLLPQHFRIVNVCDLCRQIFGNEERASVACSVIRDASSFRHTKRS